MFKVLAILSVFALSTSAFAANKATKENAAKFVPGSTFVKEDGNEFDLKTAKNTIVEVELNTDGTIDEASGDLAVDGDVFTPGNSHITLEAAAAALKKAGKTPSGDWSYKKSILRGWVYEFEGHENGVKMEYVLSATNGSLLKDKKD